jgi:O-acetyl-ADP-ribose deacetylase (regulator of RNase III)
MAGPGTPQLNEIRFGRTVLSVAVGELVDQPVQVLIAPGNKRAMFAAGATGTLWTAVGEEVERELRTHAPLEIGTAIVTGSGRLSEHGVTNIVHAIVAPGLGEPPRVLSIPEALEKAMDCVVEVQGRSVAFPIIGVSARASLEQRLVGAQIVVDAVVAHLRIRKHRIDRGILVSRFEDDRVPLEALLVRARERLWTG